MVNPYESVVALAEKLCLLTPGDFAKKAVFLKDSDIGMADVNQGIASQGSGRMPGFGSMLTTEQINAIVEYVRSL